MYYLAVFFTYLYFNIGSVEKSWMNMEAIIESPLIFLQSY